MNFLSRLVWQFALVASLVGLTACGGGDDDQVNYQTIAQGQSAITSSRTVVVRDNTTWANLWAEHAPGVLVPGVNFSEKTVLAASGGSAGSGCSNLAITSIVREAQALQVRYTISSPPQATGTTCGSTIAASTLVHIVMIDRTELPVNFIRN
ncbi:MAG: hypothetical protein V4739_06070 [Pseudomonadota bacterium]